MEKERERNIECVSLLQHPVLGIWPPTQACALTGNQTSNPLLHRLALNPLSHTSRGWFAVLKARGCWVENGLRETGEETGCKEAGPLALGGALEREGSRWSGHILGEDTVRPSVLWAMRDEKWFNLENFRLCIWCSDTDKYARECSFLIIKFIGLIFIDKIT